MATIIKTQLILTDTELAIMLAAIERSTSTLAGDSKWLPLVYKLRDRINGATDGNTFLVSERVRSEMR